MSPAMQQSPSSTSTDTAQLRGHVRCSVVEAMKVRDSGMPEQDYWETLFDVPTILERLGIDGRVRTVVEVGCGYGTFTAPVAARVGGPVHGFDIEADMIERTRARLATAGHRNVELHLRDVIAEGFGLPQESVDAVLLFNILHAENPVGLLRSSAELLAPGGRVLVIHWRSDIATPRGPSLEIRPRPEQVIRWAEEAGRLVLPGPPMLLPPWHYGIDFRR